MKEVNSIEDLFANGEQELSQLVAAGNAVAQEWLTKLQATADANRKLFLFGEMRLALMSNERPEARSVAKAMFQD